MSGLSALGDERTRVCDGDVRGVKIAEVSSDRRNGEDLDGAEGANDDGPEVGGTLASRPAQVVEGLGPESGGGIGHDED